MIKVNLYESNKFDNGEELQAIFDFAKMTFSTSFWTWVMLIVKK